MGTMGQKCSCLSNKTAMNAEESVDIDQRTNPTSNSTGSKKRKIENGFMFHGVARGRNQHFDNEDREYMLTRDQKQKLTHLQAFVRGCYLRINFFSFLKQRLRNHTKKMIDKYKSEFKTVTQYKAENNKGSFDRNGWSKYYSLESSYLFNYEQQYYGSLLFHTDIMIFNENSFYTGTINIRNQRCGSGTLVNLEGEKYEGHWVNNKFTGWGRYIDIEGNLYEGYFLNNTLNGKGEKRSLNGNSYIGDFKNNLRHGRGREETNEHYYDGEFRKDKKEGFGKLIYKGIKDSYEGEFKDNCITGTGVYVWTNGDIYEGTFLNGKMHGRGVYKWPDGGEYEGDYVDNIKQGLGIFKWSNGKIFKGPFKNSRPHGSGIMTIEKETFEVVFEDGKLVKSVKLDTLKTRDRDTISNNNTHRSNIKAGVSSNSTHISSVNRRSSNKSEFYKK